MPHIVERALREWVHLTEHRRAQDALRQNEAKLRSILDALPDVIFQINREFEVQWANKAGLDINSDILQQPCHQVFFANARSCDECPGAKALSNGEIHLATTSHGPTNGAPDNSVWEKIGVPLKDGQGNVVGALEIARNITERKRLEERLRQAQKMEAIGQLAGGIAHDFNNLLTGIIGNLSLAHMDAPRNIGKFISTANDAAMRAEKLVRQLLAFSRKSQIELRPVNINELVDEVYNLARQAIDRRIEIVVRTKKNLPFVLADAAQITPQ